MSNEIKIECETTWFKIRAMSRLADVKRDVSDPLFQVVCLLILKDYKTKPLTLGEIKILLEELHCSFEWLISGEGEAV